MRVSTLLDQVRQAQGFPSDYRIAKTLGLRTQTVSQWRSGYSYPGPLYLFELCHLAGLNPAQVTAEIELERAQRAGRDDDADRWSEWAKRLATTAAGLVVGTVGICPDAPAATSVANAQPVYIMSTWRRRLAGQVRQVAGLAARQVEGLQASLRAAFQGISGATAT